jgi:hypothetical protein
MQWKKIREWWKFQSEVWSPFQGSEIEIRGNILIHYNLPAKKVNICVDSNNIIGTALFLIAFLDHNELGSPYVFSN